MWTCECVVVVVVPAVRGALVTSSAEEEAGGVESEGCVVRLPLSLVLGWTGCVYLCTDIQ